MAIKRRIFCVEILDRSGKVDKQCGLSFSQAAKVARNEVGSGATVAQIKDNLGRASVSCFRERSSGKVRCETSRVQRNTGFIGFAYRVEGDPAAGRRRRAYGGYPD